MKRILVPLVCITLLLLFGCVLYLYLGAAASSVHASDWSGKNVILITIDTTRADALPMYGGDVKTPALSALAADGIVIDGMRSLTPLTLPSHTTILTGLHPIQHGVRDNFNGVLSDAATTLPELFRESGYQTGGVIGAIVLSRRTGISQGFDFYSDEFSPDAIQSAQPMIERKGDEVADAALAWLKERRARDPQAPLFLFAHFYDPHSFYQPPPPFDEQYKDNAYHGEIAYADHCIGRVLDYLKENQLYDDAVIVVAGDHGEGLGEHKEKTHGMFLYESTIRVPCIIKPPKRSGLHGRCDWNGSLEDIAPTLIHFCKLGRVKTNGVSMMNNFLDRAPVYRLGRKVVLETQYPLTFNWSPVYALVQDGYKYIHSPKPELYLLSEDPNEQTNLIDADRAHSLFMDSMLQMELVRLAKGAGFTPESQLSTDRSEALASLGYVGGGGVASVTDSVERADPKDRIELYEEIDAALVALSQSQIEKGRQMLESILEQDPFNPSLHLNLGFVYAKTQQWAKALASIKKAIELAPENHILKLHLAKTYINAGRLDEAKSILEAFILQFPKQADAHFQLGRIAYRQNRPENAMESFREAERWMPDIPGLDEALQKTQEKLKR
ncbi:MAG: sulfatase-like hydrolase/transferase [Candidatus Hinthialibacter antarcticus]|nr:sulfatase-like hydrolase/transferase [Candidatus Hinthialibacter antarcticus]